MARAINTLGILEAGRPPAALAEGEDYPQMFARLLGGADPRWQYRRWAVLDGELPESPVLCDAWLITGSKFGVYESHPWIAAAMDFVRAAWADGVPLVGICFGHQLMAQAFGGRVQKSERGWGVGVHRYRRGAAAPAWIDREQFAIQCLHQDQVIELPPAATVIAQSDFCPHAALLYGDRGLSFQGHPEFDADFARALIDVRRELFGPALTQQALAGVDQPLDAADVARWIVRFLRAEAL